MQTYFTRDNGLAATVNSFPWRRFYLVKLGKAGYCSTLQTLAMHQTRQGSVLAAPDLRDHASR
jgi:hypothetical protein